MVKIKQLSLQESQKIAAGQVVERPANVLKELIENSIDAGSTRIEIHIEQAGQKLLRVVDNGCGMSPEDAELSFYRHATSKLQQVDQLPHITTFGFRGEALASIAAVSIVTLITREADVQEGTKIVRKEEKNHIESISCNPGTDITIENLFYNVPARKKFLKKELTEWRQIQYIFQAFCLRYTNLHIKLHNEGKLVYNCPATDSYKNRMMQLWDITITKNTIDIPKTTKQEFTIEGAITNHQYYRYDRNGIFIFVNNRWIKNQELSRALLKGYMNALPSGRYPSASLVITMNPLHVDVNVHPRKEEVIFLHPYKIQTCITQAIQEILENHLSEQLQKKIVFKKSPFTHSYSTSHYSPLKQPQSYLNPQATNPQPLPPQSSSISVEKSLSASLPFVEVDIPTSIFQPAFTADTASAHTSLPLSDFSILGQLHATYILIEQKEGLFIVDQHAAHERILYQQFKKERFSSIETVELLFPALVNITDEQMKTIEPYLEVLYEHGLHVEQFGGGQLVVKAAPIHAKHIAFPELIQEIITWITEFDNLDIVTLKNTLHEKIHAQMACKAAVKAGDILSQEHLKKLVKDLSTTENRLTCPHGRPTGWLLSLDEIERKFKRKL